MVYGVLRFIHFAHGDVCMAGAFFFYLLRIRIGLDAVSAFLISAALCGCLGYAIERLAYRPLRTASRLSCLVTAIGVSMLLQNGFGAAFGYEPRSILPPSGAASLSVAGASFTPAQAATFAASVVLLAALFLFLKKTTTGILMRATGDNMAGAVATGIPVNRTVSLTFILGSSLAGTAGICVGSIQDIQPTMGVLLGIKAFTAAVVGGIGHLPGAVFGGFFIGLAENAGAWVFPAGFKDAVAFVILILCLVVRPGGLFRKKG
jgi:branched-chain amino acid transport system permease protein